MTIIRRCLFVVLALLLTVPAPRGALCADLEDLGVVFLRGKDSGPAARDEIRRIFHLSPAQAKDVVFSGRVERLVNCESDGVVKIVAVNQRKQLAIIERLRVPECGEP